MEQNDDECLEFLPYESDFFQNGNGSLMRILPMLWYVRGHDIVWKFQKIYQVSALTHPHILSALACFFYIQIAENILEEKDKKQAIYDAQKDLEKIVQTQEIDEKTEKEIEKWLSRNLLDIETDSIESSGFVGDSLILAVQIFFHSENFEDALKNCIRKGGDTDTLGTICGGLL